MKSSFRMSVAITLSAGLNATAQVSQVQRAKGKLFRQCCSQYQ